MQSMLRIELPRHRRRALIAGSTFVALLAIGLACASCGKHESDQTAAASATPMSAVPAMQSGTPKAAETASVKTTAVKEQSTETMTSEESVPPEVSTWASDTLVAPGSVIEIQAKASDDVKSVLLRDGIGRQQGFAYDSTAGIWHTLYRVPMLDEPGRLGVSVTARNEHNRWRRVWLFFQVEPQDE